MVELEDKIYIEQVLAGETSSYTHLVDKYKDMVFTVCYRILKQREDAEDTAQITFIKAFDKLHSFNGDSKFSTWIYTIAYRTAISKTRLMKLESTDDGLYVETSTDDAFPQLEGMKNQERKLYVQKAIDSLKEVDGVIITLYYIDESSIQEITEITGLTESNVKVKLHRARKQLKRNLEGLLRQELKSII